MLEGELDELERLLEEERAAIRSLDGARVVRFARRKRELVDLLHARRAELSSKLVGRFRALVPAIRHNGILLAHARNVLRDVVTHLGAGSMATSPSCPVPAPRGRALSVRG